MADRRRRPIAGRYPISGGEAELSAVGDSGWLLSVGGVPQSHVDLGDPELLEFEYLRLMGDVIDCLEPGPLAAAHVGGAACTLPRYVAATRPRSRQVVFEPDAALVQLVRDQLALGKVPGLKVRVTGGREGVAALPDEADDLLVVDAFSAAVMPVELATQEFVRDAARVLRPNGVYLVNVADGAPLAFARRAAATVRSVFPHSLLLGEPGVLRGRRFGNLVIVGSHAPLPVAALTRRAAGGIVQARCVDDLDRFCSGAAPLHDGGVAPVPVPPPPLFR